MEDKEHRKLMEKGQKTNEAAEKKMRLAEEGMALLKRSKMTIKKQRKRSSWPKWTRAVCAPLTELKFPFAMVPLWAKTIPHGLPGEEVRIE